MRRQVHGAMNIDRMMRDEEGFTTAGMAVALLVTLSLLFSAAQVYRINTVSAEVQDVADAAALAAQNQVAEFMVAVRVVDGAVLSLSLLGSAAYGLGGVGLCVPPAAEVGAKLVSAGQKALQARDRFAERAAASLNELQQALPFMAAAAAASVASANGADRGAGYHAIALLLPAEGETIAVGANGAEAAMEEAVQQEQEALADAAARAEEATRRANEAKQRAFQRDCGDNPAYCMYERAAHLAGLDGADNPLYQSVDAWSFPVARDRALAYYRARLLGDRPENDSVEAEARSVLRKHFYAYAVKQLRETDIRETPTGLEGAFPRFPRNMDQLRHTTLYTHTKYPVELGEEEGQLPVMHAWEGCPGLGLTDHFDSVKTLEEGAFATCGECQFTPSSLGNVASASTAIDNGFEYHYDAVAQAAEEYQAALREAAPLAAEVKREAQGLLDKVGEALGGAASMRIDAAPPGSVGCIALVVAPGNAAAPSSPFVSGNAALGARAALAAATLVPDDTEGASVIGNLLDGLEGPAGATGPARLVLRCWSGLLGAYGRGQDALVGAVETALDGLPLVGAAGLGSWAADALRGALEAAGLEPADVRPLKPVLAQSTAVARADGGDYALRFLSLRDQVLASPLSSANPVGALADRIERDAYDRLAALEIEIACIELPLGLGDIPLTLALPPLVVDGAQGLVERATEALRGAAGALGWTDPWE